MIANMTHNIPPIIQQGIQPNIFTRPYNRKTQNTRRFPLTLEEIVKYIIYFIY